MTTMFACVEFGVIASDAGPKAVHRYYPVAAGNRPAVDRTERRGSAMDGPDLILVAAVRYPWGEIVTGRRHRNVYEAMALKGITSRDGCEEGFVGRSGTFYTREAATRVAISARQISADHSGALNSEQLWPLTPAEKAKWRDG